MDLDYTLVRRYNPGEGTRKKYLMETLKYVKTHTPIDEFEYLKVCKIYYDGFTKDKFEIEVIDLVGVVK